MKTATHKKTWDRRLCSGCVAIKIWFAYTHECWLQEKCDEPKNSASTRRIAKGRKRRTALADGSNRTKRAVIAREPMDVLCTHFGTRRPADRLMWKRMGTGRARREHSFASDTARDRYERSHTTFLWCFRLCVNNSTFVVFTQCLWNLSSLLGETTSFHLFTFYIVSKR